MKENKLSLNYLNTITMKCILYLELCDTYVQDISFQETKGEKCPWSTGSGEVVLLGIFPPQGSTHQEVYKRRPVSHSGQLCSVILSGQFSLVSTVEIIWQDAVLQIRKQGTRNCDGEGVNTALKLMCDKCKKY